MESALLVAPNERTALSNRASRPPRRQLVPSRAATGEMLEACPPNDVRAALKPVDSGLPGQVRPQHSRDPRVMKVSIVLTFVLAGAPVEARIPLWFVLWCAVARIQPTRNAGVARLRKSPTTGDSWW